MCNKVGLKKKVGVFILREDVIKNVVPLGKINLISEVGSFNDSTLGKLLVDGF